MCGLTGFARHPEAPELGRALEALTRMLVRMEDRGKHATGIAACLSATRPDTVSKWAVKASVAVASEPYKAALDAIAGDTQVVMGHVRHATHNNAHKDEAAHPFQIGKVVGAHNGIIYNWQEVEDELLKLKRLPKDHVRWTVDSEAALGALATHKDASRALDMLDGYWSLTWTKGRHLYFCRTAAAPLCVAYSASTRTLFWHSVRATLTNTLVELGYHDIEVWETTPAVLYQYEPTKFNDKGTHAQKFKQHFKGRRDYGTSAGFNSARPNESGARRRTWADADERFAPTMRTAVTTQNWKNNGGAVSLLDLEVLVRKLAATVQRHEKELEVLYRLAEVTPEEVQALFAEEEAPAPTAQLPLLPPAGPVTPPADVAGEVCGECGRGPAWGKLLPTDDGLVHEGCVMSWAGRAS